MSQLFYLNFEYYLPYGTLESAKGPESEDFLETRFFVQKPLVMCQKFHQKDQLIMWKFEKRQGDRANDNLALHIK